MPILPLSGMSRRSQWLIMAVLALALSLLTFAGSFADAPHSQYLPDVATPR